MSNKRQRNVTVHDEEVQDVVNDDMEIKLKYFYSNYNDKVLYQDRMYFDDDNFQIKCSKVLKIKYLNR